MENASKALIIAGAILLAILIIGLGIYIYNQAANSMGDTGIDKMEIQQINGQFAQYLDVDLSSVQAKALIDTINSMKDVELVSGTETGVTYVTSKGDITNGNTYQAVPTYKTAGDPTTLLYQIAIKDVTPTPNP